MAAALTLASVLLLGLALGNATAPAASACKVTLKSSPARPYANTPVTITASASNCDTIKKIVADASVSGARTFPCSSGSSTCTISVTAAKPQLVHFTAQATKGGRTVTSDRIAVRWSKPPPKPGTFSLTIKNSSGKTVWKGVQNLATGRTTYPVGGSSNLTLPGGSKVTVSAAWNVPISRGGYVRIRKDVWNDTDAYGTSRTTTACKTTTVGDTGCSAKLTLPKRDDHGHEVAHFYSEGLAASRGYGGWVTAWVYLGAPKS